MLHEVAGRVRGRPAVLGMSSAQVKPATARSFPRSSSCVLRACPALAGATTLRPGLGHAGVGLRGRSRARKGPQPFHLSQGPAL